MGQMNMEEMVAAGKTPADHEPLAARYAQEAAAPGLAQTRTATWRRHTARRVGQIVSELHFERTL